MIHKFVTCKSIFLKPYQAINKPNVHSTSFRVISSIVSAGACSRYVYSNCDKREYSTISTISSPDISNSTFNTPAHISIPNINKYLSRRQLQTNFGECPTFSLFPPSDIITTTNKSLGDVSVAVKSRLNDVSNGTIFVLDVCEGDFGSRANFGRGNNAEALLQPWCLSSYDIFLRRLMNIAVNSLNRSFIDSLCVVGSVDCTDLTEKCTNKNPSVNEERADLIDAVRVQHQRTSHLVQTVYESAFAVNQHATKIYMVNGDHNHMTGIVEGYVKATENKQRPVDKPIIVYLDLHADSRPPEDGPHSGTWICDVYNNNLVAGAYCVGLNPLANTDLTIKNLDKYGVKYRDFCWDNIKLSGSTDGDALIKMARDISNEIKVKYGGRSSNPPVILSICGDSVLHLPSSAGTGTIGYEAEDVYKFINIVCGECNVVGLTVAELKTSLGTPSNINLVGEFLTQCLFTYHKSSKT